MLQFRYRFRQNSLEYRVEQTLVAKAHLLVALRNSVLSGV